MYVITNSTPVTLAIFWGFTWGLLSLMRSTTGDYHPTWWWLRPRSYSVTLRPINHLLPSAGTPRSVFPPYGRLSAPLRFPAHLLGGGLVKLGASRDGCGFRGLLAPFGEERVAQPDQREPQRHAHVPLERVREQRHRDGSKGPCDCE